MLRCGGSKEVGKLATVSINMPSQLLPILLTVRSNIPPGTEDQKVRKRCRRVSRGRGQNTENRRVDVVNRD